MIIFDLDGTLADCEHRRHFVDLDKMHPSQMGLEYSDGRKWKPDWQAFYEACDKDMPIPATAAIYEGLAYSFKEMDIHIWSGRNESVREKTLDWLISNFFWENANRAYLSSTLKMRPIGNTEPDEVLKERWLDEISIGVNPISGSIRQFNPIDFVFDSHPASIEMWRRRGIFVFNCCQHNEAF